MLPAFVIFVIFVIFVCSLCFSIRKWLGRGLPHLHTDDTAHVPKVHLLPFLPWYGIVPWYSSSGESFTAIRRICALHRTVSPTRTYRRLYLSHCCWARPNPQWKLAPNKNNSKMFKLKGKHLQTYCPDRKQSNGMSSTWWLQPRQVIACTANEAQRNCTRLLSATQRLRDRSTSCKLLCTCWPHLSSPRNVW